jgi:AP-1-like factor
MSALTRCIAPAKLMCITQDSDLADLCSEFSNKARCDGTKVVLEPQGVRNIIESLGMKHNRK